MDRREFLKITLLSSGALLVGVNFAACGGGNAQQKAMESIAAQRGELTPNAWITIQPDGRVRVAAEKSEMGQGVLTSHAMLVAEELDVPMSSIDIASADASPRFARQVTGGSTSVRETYIPLRTAAATTRALLVAAAASRWGVSVGELTTEDGVVIHAASQRHAPYGELTREAATQPIPENVALKDPADFKVLGTDTTRVDAAAKVTGTAVFGTDVEVAGMVKAFVIRPPVMGSEPVSFDAREASRMPGVLAVVDFPRGVAVLAEKYWQARRAAAKVTVRWSEVPLAKVSSTTIRALATDAVEGKGATVHEVGNLDRALERDDITRVEATYEAPYLAHATMEPMNCTASVTDAGVEVWAPTQAPGLIQEVGAQICGIDREKVTVHVTLLGGGFGRRASPDFSAEAIELSRRVGRPVQVIWSREDDTAGGYYRPYALNRMEGAVDAEGRAVAWRYHSVSQPISTDLTRWISAMLPDWMPRIARRVMTKSAGGLFRSGTVPEFISTEGATHIPYSVANQRIEFTPLQTPVPNAFWRSVGHSYNGFVVESFVDELAHAAGADPYEFRRSQMHDVRLRGVMDKVAELANWGAPLDGGYARGIAAHASYGSFCAQVAEAKITDGEIDVRRVYCVIDCGTVVNPDIVIANQESSIIFGLSAALRQKITLKDGVIEQGNFDDFPLLRMFESPEIIVHVVESGASPTGAGEPGLPPIAPAVANAVFAASNIRMRTMPFVDALREHYDREGR